MENQTMMQESSMEDSVERTAANSKAARRNFSKLGFIYVAGIVVLYVLVYAIKQVILGLNPAILDDSDLSLLLLSILPMYLAVFPLIVVLLKKSVPAVKPRKRRMSAGQYILALIVCIGLAYASNFVGILITTIVGLIRQTTVDNSILSVATNVSPITILFYMVILAPIMEEFMFRKMIVDHTMQYGKGISILLSGLMFGLFHGNLNQFVYAFSIGCFLAFIYVRTGNLKITISMHMFFNFMGGFVATNLLKYLHLDEYMAALESGSDVGAAMSVIGDNLLAWGCYLLFVLFVFGTTITGVVLFIVFACQKRFRLTEDSPNALEKGKRLSAVVLNPGMLVYILFWVSMIGLQLMGVL